MTAGGFIIPNGYQELQKAQDSPRWSTTEGIIISSEIQEHKKDEDSTTYFANVHYKYTVGEKPYTSDQVSFGQYGSGDPEHARSIVSRYPAGQKVIVHFNPTHPDQSVLEPGATWSSYMVLGFGMIFFGIGAITVVSMGVIVPKLQQKRTEALRQAASTLALTFLEQDKTLFQEAFFQLPLFQRGSSREVSNVLRKRSVKGETILFDYEFEEGSGDRSNRYQQTVAACHVPNRNLPQFSLRPEYGFDKIGEFFGQQDIDFESSPEFSKSYRLQGELEPAIREAFNFKVLQFFSQNPHWWLEGRGEWLIIYQSQRQVKPKDLSIFLQQATQISDLFS
ncbi:DUF3592 domain-containing protein [Leptodesmis sichuanensis]|nr:DUF3592 domain-containing protein [Leptodesmis sichuanensis A121]